MRGAPERDRVGCRRGWIGAVALCFACALAHSAAAQSADQAAVPPPGSISPNPPTVAASPAARAAYEALPLGRSSVPASASPGAEPAQKSSAGQILQTGLVLSIVVGIILVLGAIARKLARSKGGLLSQLGAGGRAPAGVLEVLGRYPVSRGSTLVLLKLDRRVLLTCQTVGRKFAGPSMTTLCEINDPEEVASLLLKTREEEGDTMARKFQAMLAREEAWPKATPLSTQVETIDVTTNAFEPEPAAIEAPPAKHRGPSEAQLSRALSVLRSRVDSIAAPRQPLARGGRA